MYKAIVFDMDDTLVQTRKVKYKAHQHTAKKFYNLELSDADLDEHWGKPFNELIGLLYGNVAPLDKILANYYSIGKDFQLIAHDGAPEVISHFSTHFLTGLVTATNTPLMISALSESGIDRNLFAYIQTSDDTNFHKPDPKVFDPALKFFAQKGIKPQEIVYIGDVLSDYYAATGAGLQFVGIAGHSIPASEFTKVGAPSVNALSELIDLLSW